MKLIIDIPEQMYLNAKSDTLCGADILVRAIKKATPLPKGHGKIGDLDAVMSDISTSISEMTNIGIMVDGEYLWGKLNDAIDNAQSIIEADKEYEVKVITRGNCMICGKELTEGLFICQECGEKANSRK